MSKLVQECSEAWTAQARTLFLDLKLKKKIPYLDDRFISFKPLKGKKLNVQISGELDLAMDLSQNSLIMFWEKHL